MIGTDGKPVNCECNIYNGATPLSSRDDEVGKLDKERVMQYNIEKAISNKFFDCHKKPKLAEVHSNAYDYTSYVDAWSEVLNKPKIRTPLFDLIHGLILGEILEDIKENQ